VRAGRRPEAIEALQRSAAVTDAEQSPSLPNLVKILRVLGCSAEDFGKRLGPSGCLD